MNLHGFGYWYLLESALMQQLVRAEPPQVQVRRGLQQEIDGDPRRARRGGRADGPEAQLVQSRLKIGARHKA